MSFSPLGIPPQNADLQTNKGWYRRGWMWLLALAVALGALIIR